MGALALTTVLLAAQQASGAEGFRAVLARHSDDYGHSAYETVQVDASGKVQRRAGIVLLVNGKPHELRVTYTGGVQPSGQGRDARTEPVPLSRFHLVPFGGGASRELALPGKVPDAERHGAASVVTLVGPYMSIDTGDFTASRPETFDLRTGKRVTMGSIDPKAPKLAKESFKDIQDTCWQYDPKAHFKLYWDEDSFLAMHVRWEQDTTNCLMSDDPGPKEAAFYVAGGALKRYVSEDGELKGKAGRMYLGAREKQRVLLAEVGGKTVELGEVSELVGWESDANLPPEAFDPEASLATELRLAEELLLEASEPRGQMLKEAEALLAKLKARGVPQADALLARADALRHPLRGVPVELLDAGAGDARLDEAQKLLEAQGAQVVKRGPAQTPRKDNTIYATEDDRLARIAAYDVLLKLGLPRTEPLTWKSPGKLVVVLGKK
jgi:hypothetical protein